MNDITTILISPQKPINDPGFKFTWISTTYELKANLIARPRDCFIIDYSKVDHGFDFDKELFLSQASEFSAVQGLAFKINRGEPLVTLGSDFKMLNDEAHSQDIYRDGLERVPLYYLSKIAALDFITDTGVSIPVGNYGLPIAFSKLNLDYRKKRPALFLDRDGVINRDVGYVHKHEEIEYLESIFPIIELFNKRNWPVFVITNQSGVAQGMYSEEDVISLHKKMEVDLFKRNLVIKEWVYCPYHFEKGQGDFKRHSFTRKPGAGMALSLLEKHAIDVEKSFMIGDKESDNILIKGLNFLQVKGKYPYNEANSFCFDSFSKIQDYIQGKIV